MRRMPALPRLVHEVLAWRRFGPGLALAAVLAMAASTVSRVHGGPPPLYALFFGLAFHHLSQEPRTQAGIDLCARTVLRLGVGLLGARIAATQVAALGWPAAVLVVLGVVSTIGLALALGRWLGLGAAHATLAGCAVAICGASAALAVAAVLPADRIGHAARGGGGDTVGLEHRALAVVLSITVMSTAAMVLYPVLARVLHLGPLQAGLFLGGSIHDVAQVVGAGFTLGPETGDLATVVKLFRVALLAGVVVAVALAFRPRAGEVGEAAAAAELGNGESAPARLPPPPRLPRQPLLPWFLWLFAALVLLNSLVAVPAAVQRGLSEVSQACLLMALAALGVKTSLQHLRHEGWQPLALVGGLSLWLAALMLAGAWWLYGASPA